MADNANSKPDPDSAMTLEQIRMRDLVAHLRANPAEEAQVCQQELGTRSHQAIARLAQDLGARYAPERATLRRYQVYHPAQRPVLARLAELIATWPAGLKEGRGLIFLGPVGTGKDHLCAALLYLAATHGVACRWVNGQELFGTFRDRMDSKEREGELLAELSEPGVLAISDPVPPAGDVSAWNLGLLYRLVDRRYRELKPTWLTLNAVDEADADSRLSAPLWDRLREGAEVFRCFWPSFRGR